MAAIGYVRVSTSDQNLDLQISAMRQAGIKKIFKDEGVSGSLASRPGLDAAREYLREGDTLVTWKLDRLGRNTRNLLTLIEELEEQGIGFQSLTEGLDTRGPFGKVVVTVLAALAAFERDQLIERTRAGLAAARAKGNVGGRPRKLDNKASAFAREMYDTGKYSVTELAAQLNVSVPTIYRYLKHEEAATLTDSLAA